MDDVRARTRRAALRPAGALMALGAIVLGRGLLGRDAVLALALAFFAMRLRLRLPEIAAWLRPSRAPDLRAPMAAPRLRFAVSAGAVIAFLAAMAIGGDAVVAACVAAGAAAAGLARRWTAFALALAAGGLALLGAGEVLAGAALIAAGLAAR
jgi:hypothetical protein